MSGSGCIMVQHELAAEIARQILLGFDDYREHFRLITEGARARFEQAQWQEAQRASAARISLYEEKVGKPGAVCWPASIMPTCSRSRPGRRLRVPTSS